jgi:hypothetical protein
VGFRGGTTFPCAGTADSPVFDESETMLLVAWDSRGFDGEAVVALCWLGCFNSLMQAESLERTWGVCREWRAGRLAKASIL